MGMYHDSTEIITGDMPTPVKYYSPVIRNAYNDVEKKQRTNCLQEYRRKCSLFMHHYF